MHPEACAARRPERFPSQRAQARARGALRPARWPPEQHRQRVCEGQAQIACPTNRYVWCYSRRVQCGRRIGPCCVTNGRILRGYGVRANNRRVHRHPEARGDDADETFATTETYSQYRPVRQLMSSKMIEAILQRAEASGASRCRASIRPQNSSRSGSASESCVSQRKVARRRQMLLRSRRNRQLGEIQQPFSSSNEGLQERTSYAIDDLPQLAFDAIESKASRLIGRNEALKA